MLFKVESQSKHRLEQWTERFHPVVRVRTAVSESWLGNRRVNKDVCVCAGTNSSRPLYKRSWLASHARRERQRVRTSLERCREREHRRGRSQRKPNSWWDTSPYFSTEVERCMQMRSDSTALQTWMRNSKLSGGLKNVHKFCFFKKRGLFFSLGDAHTVHYQLSYSHE